MRIKQARLEELIMNNISGFLSKTYDIFSDPENDQVCSWSPTGDTIIVKKVEHLSLDIYDKYMYITTTPRLTSFQSGFYLNISSIQTFNHLFDN